MISSKPLLCASCARPNHTSFSCPYKRRAVLKAKRPMRRGKRLKPMGRISKALQDQRAQFFEEHEPPYICVYCLVIGYENILMPEWVNVEHGESKARHPDRRFAKSNLYVSCGFHNQDKASTDIDEYIEKLRGPGGAVINNRGTSK